MRNIVKIRRNKLHFYTSTKTKFCAFFSNVQLHINDFFAKCVNTKGYNFDKILI